MLVHQLANGLVLGSIYALCALGFTLIFGAARVVNAKNSSEMIRSRVAMLPEGRHIFPELTVKENLELSAYYRKDTAAVNADFERAIDLFPILHERLGQHSGLLSVSSSRWWPSGGR